MGTDEAIPPSAIARIVHPESGDHLGWVIAEGKLEVGYAVKADDGATLVMPYRGPIPEGARMVVVLEVVP